MQSKLVLSLRGVDVYSSPMSFVRGSAAITNPGLAGHAYLGSVNPSPLLAHSHINTSIHPLHTSHFVLFFLLCMNKHFCSKIIRCFYEQKLHIYILNVLQCVLSEPKNNSCSRFCSVQTSIEQLELESSLNRQRHIRSDLEKGFSVNFCDSQLTVNYVTSFLFS